MNHSEATRNKISKALMGHIVTPETLAKLRGRKRTSEQRKRISDACKGRTPWNKGKTGVYSKETLEKIRIKTKEAMAKYVFTDEQRYKMGNATRGKKASAENRQNRRVAQYKRFEKEIEGYHYEENGRRIRRKVRLKTNGGFHSKKEWEQLKEKSDFTCQSCGKKEPEIKLTKDHILAVRHGGTDDITNIQPLCRSCNSRKH